MDDEDVQSGVVLGLGSNLGDREAAPRRGARARSTRAALASRAVSSLYETEPVGGPPQGSYLNAVADGETALSPGGAPRRRASRSEREVGPRAQRAPTRRAPSTSTSSSSATSCVRAAGLTAPAPAAARAALRARAAGRDRARRAASRARPHASRSCWPPARTTRAVERLGPAAGAR